VDAEADELMTAKLKPCPFCGSDVRLDVKKGRNAIHSPFYREQVICKNKSCRASGRLEKRPGLAVEKWNKRPEEERLREGLRLNEKFLVNAEDELERLKS
jgi:Lar family restriction alleviation protein